MDAPRPRSSARSDGRTRTGAGTVPAPVGVRGIRPQDETKLRGEHRFAPMLHTDGELHAVTVRAPVSRAGIRRVETAAALRVPGAVTVLTGADLPGRRLGSKVQDQPVLAQHEIRHFGEPVALVVATSARAARTMATVLTLDLDVLPPLVDPSRALDAEAPQVGPDGNLVTTARTCRGDARGKRVVRRSWRTGRQDAAFLAPEAGLAVPDPDGTVHLWVATQDLHADHLQVTRALGLRADGLVLHHAGIGGAFGGREDITVQAHLVLAALRTGRPVRMAYTRAESLAAHPSRHPMRTEVELTCDDDGRFVSLRTRTLLDGGAYAHTSLPVTAIVHDFSAGMYRFDAVDLETTTVYTNNPPAGAMRGFGATQACFLIESTVDAVAAELGIDPIDLRRRNLLEPEEPLATTGQPLAGCADPREVLDAALSVPEPARAPAEGMRRGTGVALGIKSAGLGHGKPDPATAAVRLTRSGVEVISAAADVGQGVDEVLRRMVGHHFPGLPVTVRVADTSFPTAGGSKASRQTMASGGAAAGAAERLAQRLRERARDKGRPVPDRWSHDDLTALLGDDHADTWTETDTNDGPPTGPGRPHKAFQIMAHRAVVDVDELTGECSVVQVVCAQDCGRAVDPVAVEGQLVGGTVQGVGFALWEERDVDAEGRQLTTGFGDYLLPGATDVPEVVPVIVEHPKLDLAFGAKGIGEGPLVSSPAAVAAAIRAATGEPVASIPARRVVPTRSEVPA
ncbi:xanthine dehydrogenase family protein molybdopterin-binding subunit [Rhodococcus sp. Z13]